MKKAIIALMSLAGMASADFQWNAEAGNYTNTDWCTQSNWTGYTSTWVEGKGPGGLGSNMYGEAITINNASIFTGVAFESWALKLTLSNGAQIKDATFKNISGGGYINIGSGCVFSGAQTGGGNANNGTITYTVADAGALTLSYGHNGYGDGSNIFNLGENGSVNLTSTNGRAIGGKNTFNATLVASEQGGLTSRVLAEVSNLTLNDLQYNFEGWTLSTEEITEANYMNHIGEYWVSDADNKLTVYYATAPIPEPTTATLSLLALAGLAARRRRK